MAKRQWTQTEIQEILFKHKKAPQTLFLHEDAQALAQVAQRGYGVSILADIQSPTGRGPENPAVAGPALSRGLDQTTSRGAFPPQPVWDSLNIKHKDSNLPAVLRLNITCKLI